MSLKKDDILIVEIEDMSHDGAGIGKSDGYPLFIKDTVIGDIVETKVIKAKKNYGYGRMMRLLTPSVHRVEPRCPIATKCGGCQLQMMDYKEQLKYKENKVRANLERIGGFKGIHIEKIISTEETFHYRNKAQYPVGMNREGEILAGFYAGRTHSIIETEKCYLGMPVNEEVLKIVKDWMRTNRISAYDERSGKGLIRHVLIRYGYTTKEVMVCLVINGRKMPPKETEDLVKDLRSVEGMTSITYSVNRENTNVIMGNTYELLWGKEHITDYIGDIKYQISPLSFFQVNARQTKKLYDTALAYADLKGNEIVWDIYCGIGTISLFLARQASEVYGVEIIPQSIENAKENAKLNGIKNATFFCGKAEEVVPQKYKAEGIKADVIVVDPPRKGCDETLLKTITDVAPKRIVYVSCDSATLARDLKYLCEHGYGIEKVQPVDMFAMTVHVETVCLMSKVR